MAEHLGAKHTPAQIELEVGRRLSRPDCIERAAALFSDGGFAEGAAEARCDLKASGML